MMCDVFSTKLIKIHLPVFDVVIYCESDTGKQNAEVQCFISAFKMSYSIWHQSDHKYLKFK